METRSSAEKPGDDWAVKVGNLVYSVKMLEGLYEAGVLDEFSYHRYKRAAKPFDPTVTYGLDRCESNFSLYPSKDVS